MKKLHIDYPGMFFNCVGGETWYYSTEDNELVSESDIRDKFDHEDLNLKSLSNRYIELPYREEFEKEALYIFWKSLTEEQYAAADRCRGKGFYSNLLACGLYDMLDEIRNTLFREEIDEWATQYDFQVVYP